MRASSRSASLQSRLSKHFAAVCWSVLQPLRCCGFGVKGLNGIKVLRNACCKLLVAQRRPNPIGEGANREGAELLRR
eukprot:2708057-Alexandrium_andersonii.AAC.1